MESNTRKLIGEIQDEVFKSSELTPNRAAEILTMTSALLGNINDKIKNTEIIYNKKLLECFDQEEKANRAKIIAETSIEYENKLTARNTKELAVEIARSLKYYLRAKEEELRLSNNQQ